MNSLFRYPGGKSRRSVQQLILSYAPENFRAYREPFVGGGGIFFGVDPSNPRWINDMNTDLIAVYLALRDRPSQFIALCRSIAPAQLGERQEQSVTGIAYNKRLKDLFYSLRDDPHADPALRYFFLNRTGYAGRVVLRGDRISRTVFSNAAGWNIVATDRLSHAAGHLRGTHITAGDYEPLFSTPGEGVFLFADPPYLRDTELPRSGKLYQHGFTLDDHRRLAEVVRRCQHPVCLSYDDHDLVRELYSDFYVHEHSWTYCGTSLKRKPKGRELIITNYPVPEERTRVLRSGSMDFDVTASVRRSRIPYGSETQPWDISIPCHDCGAVVGHLHQPGCDAEECPRCGRQKISCGCRHKAGVMPASDETAGAV